MADINARATELSITSCPAKMFRFEEDCSELSGKTLTGLDHLRYLPIDEDGSWWLQLGGQYRFRLEHLDEPNYGIGGIPGYTAEGNRLFGDALLRSSAGFMLFLELGVATEQGRKPSERTFDHSAIDLTQGFIEIPVPFGAWQGALRLGRQELDSGGNRLLSAREVANIRRAFDMALASITHATLGLQFFAGRPVINGPGAFDDRWSSTEKVIGALAMWRPFTFAPSSSVGVFYLDRTLNRQLAPLTFVPERRRTFGLRSSVQNEGWDGATQASWQWGQQAKRNIRAYGIAGELGHTWRDMPATPRAGVSAGWASGDSSPARGDVGTFDVIYPSLDYFTDAPLSYPGNTFDIRPTLRGSPIGILTVQAGADWIFRIDRSDAVFAPPGSVLIPGGLAPGGRVVKLEDIRATWHFLPRWDVLASVVRGEPGPVLQFAHARDALFVLFQITGKL